MKPFLVPLSILLLIPDALAADPPLPVEARKPVSAARTAEDLWAEALWLTISNRDGTEEEIAALFTAALQKATEKAPIYVSFGEVESQALALRKLQADFEKATSELLEELKADVAGELKEKLENIDRKDRKAVTQAVRTALKNSYRKIGENPQTRRRMLELVETMGKTSDASLGLYLAAIAEDPEYLPAWFALATRAEGETRDRAIAEFKRLDPDNALPWYLDALVIIEEGENLPAALKQVQQGNRKPSLRHYPPPVPRKFSLQYPDDEFSRENGIAGNPVPTSALEFVFQSQYGLIATAFGNGSFENDLRGLGRLFCDEGKRCLKAGKLAEGEEYLKAARTLGFQVMRAQPGDMMLHFTGQAIAAICYDDLKTHFSNTQEKQKLAALEKSRSVRQQVRDEIRKYLFQKKDDFEKNLRAVLTGEVKPVEEDQRKIREALIKAGLIEQSPDTAKQE